MKASLAKTLLWNSTKQWTISLGFHNIGFILNCNYHFLILTRYTYLSDFQIHITSCSRRHEKLKMLSFSTSKWEVMGISKSLGYVYWSVHLNLSLSMDDCANRKHTIHLKSFSTCFAWLEILCVQKINGLRANVHLNRLFEMM